MSTESLLKIEGLSISVDLSSPSKKRKLSSNDFLDLTDKVSFEIQPGELFALVGESGCGKTVTAQAILRLLPVPGGRIKEGKIYFKGRNIFPEIQSIRGREIAMIFQEASSALNPLHPLSKQLEEVFLIHRLIKNKTDEGWSRARKRIRELLFRMAFSDPDRILSSYPHQLSGGMLQRVMIAMALLLRPKLLIADEPTTALDVTAQAEVMELLGESCKKDGEEATSVLLITHNLGIVAQYAERLAVMYAGRIVEEAPVKEFFQKRGQAKEEKGYGKGALHPYSQGLLRAFPDIQKQKKIESIQGQVPPPSKYEEGCRFRLRCEEALERCREKPAFKEGEGKRKVACFLYD